METKTILKNEINRKSLMICKNILKLFFIISILCCFWSCNENEFDNTDDSEILKDAIFITDDTDFEEGVITYTNENNEEVSLFAYKGLIVIYFQDDINLKSATKIITELNG